VDILKPDKPSDTPFLEIDEATDSELVEGAAKIPFLIPDDRLPEVDASTIVDIVVGYEDTGYLPPEHRQQLIGIFHRLIGPRSN